MMKRSAVAAILFLLLTICSAGAQVLTDAPGTPTQDVVLSLKAIWQDEEKTPYDLAVMPADQLTMDTATDVFTFTYKEENRPARYFPEETQQAIAAMYGVDPDILHMTELMRLHAGQMEPPADLENRMTVDVEYEPGQLVVVVLGDTTDPEAIVWTPVLARVKTTGVIEFEIPRELMALLQGEDVLFSLLTVREGQGAGDAFLQEETISSEIPSKTAPDSTRIVDAGADGDGQGSHRFWLRVVGENEVIRKELDKISRHIVEEKLPASTHLPQESQNEFDLLIGQACSVQEMPIYEYVCLITEEYRDTDGDAAARLAFATPYEMGQTVVTALGLPREDAKDEDPTLMNWAVQRAEVMEEGRVEIVFDQLALIGMGEEKGLLLVFSEPLAQ
ncbi:MAG: hypothetical protein IKB82_04650 [Clostridia bacterium]|nr:hypothetical protein [Clostridia bacterium]